MDENHDYCYECSGYGDDYFTNKNGELECRCPDCPLNPFKSEEDWSKWT